MLGDPRALGLPLGGRAGGQNTKPVPALLASPKPFTWVMSHKMHVKVC